jgi:NADH dehydrogenase
MPSLQLPGTAMDAAGARASDAEGRPRGRPRVVIAGGGFAGVAAAHELRFCDADVVVIDRRNHYIFQPLLYQVATAMLAPSDIAAPLRQLAQRQRNVSVVLGELVGVDRDARSVRSCRSGLERRASTTTSS